MVWVTMFVRFLLFVAYLALGMLIFRTLERPTTMQHREELAQKRQDLLINMTATYNMTKAEILEFVRKATVAFAEPPMEWNYLNSFAFALQTITTIGYGIIVPVTKGGRVLCIFYALFGIPVAALLLQSVGQALCQYISALIRYAEIKCMGVDEPSRVAHKCVYATFAFYVLIVLVGAAIYQAIGEGPFLEGIYAWFVTFTTIGYGDIVPGGRSRNPWVIWIRLILILTGLSVTSSVLNSIASYLESRDASAVCRCVVTECSGMRLAKTSQCASNEIELDKGSL